MPTDYFDQGSSFTLHEASRQPRSRTDINDFLPQEKDHVNSLRSGNHHTTLPSTYSHSIISAKLPDSFWFSFVNNYAKQLSPFLLNALAVVQRMQFLSLSFLSNFYLFLLTDTRLSDHSWHDVVDIPSCQTLGTSLLTQIRVGCFMCPLFSMSLMNTIDTFPYVFCEARIFWPFCAVESKR